jgi:hypothetical protein
MARLPIDLRSLARSHPEIALRQLAGIAENGESEAARVSACAHLLDRGWGKPTQPHTGEDDKDIRFTIRNITESRS